MHASMHATTACRRSIRRLRERLAAQPQPEAVWCAHSAGRRLGVAALETIIVLVALVLLAVPVGVVIALVWIAGLRRRVAALEQRLAQWQSSGAERADAPAQAPADAQGRAWERPDEAPDVGAGPGSVADRDLPGYRASDAARQDVGWDAPGADHQGLVCLARRCRRHCRCRHLQMRWRAVQSWGRNVPARKRRQRALSRRNRNRHKRNHPSFQPRPAPSRARPAP